MSAPKRGEREGQRGQHPIQRAERQLARKDLGGERQRQFGGEQRIEREWDGRADREARDDADQRHDQELDQRQRNCRAAARPQRLEDRQRRLLALDEALRGVGDADTADHQRDQTDQGQELAEAVEVAGEIGRDIGAGARLPTGLGEGRLGRIGQRFDRGVAGRRAIADRGRGSSSGSTRRAE